MTDKKAVSNSTWLVQYATEDDAFQLARIGRLAFSESEINKYIRPACRRPSGWTDQDRDESTAKQMRKLLLKNQEIRKIHVIKAVDSEHPEIVAGYARWTRENYADLKDGAAPETENTGLPDEKDVEVDHEAVKQLMSAVRSNSKRVMESKENWNLLGIATHPDYLRRGVASVLINWGIERANRDQLPVVIESVPHAVPVYASKGCKEVGHFKFDYHPKDEAGMEKEETRTINLVVMALELV